MENYGEKGDGMLEAELEVVSFGIYLVPESTSGSKMMKS